MILDIHLHAASIRLTHRAVRKYIWRKPIKIPVEINIKTVSQILVMDMSMMALEACIRNYNRKPTQTEKKKIIRLKIKNVFSFLIFSHKYNLIHTLSV